MDERLLTLNIVWLFTIVTLPFTTTVLSSHFADSPAIFLYSLNILLVTVLQNFIWDYSVLQKGFIDNESLSGEGKKRFQTMCNLDMVNGFIAVILSFFFPVLAFILLFTKVPIFVIGTLYIARQKRKVMSDKKATPPERHQRWKKH